MNRKKLMIHSVFLMIMTHLAGMSFTGDSRVWDVIEDPAFDGFGRLIFPVDKSINRDMTLEEVGNILTWYNFVNTDRTVEIVNYMKGEAEAGEQIF